MTGRGRSALLANDRQPVADGEHHDLDARVGRDEVVESTVADLAVTPDRHSALLDFLHREKDPAVRQAVKKVSIITDVHPRQSICRPRSQRWHEHAKLDHLNTMRLPCTARFLACVSTEDQLQQVLRSVLARRWL